MEYEVWEGKYDRYIKAMVERSEWTGLGLSVGGLIVKTLTVVFIHKKIARINDSRACLGKGP